MQSKPSQTTPIFIGFGLCLLAVCAVTVIAWQAIEASFVKVDQTSDYDALVRVEQSLRHFTAARVAMLRFRETRDLKFDNQAKKCLDEAFKSADGVFLIPGNHRMLMELYKQFEELYHKDIEIGQQIDRMSPGPEDTLPDLRRAVQEEQNTLAAEIEMVVDDLSHIMYKYVADFEEVTRMRLQFMRMLLLVSSTVATLVVIASCFVVVRMVSRPVGYPVTSPYADEFSSPTPPDDLRAVANKLQEVVDLLRK